LSEESSQKHHFVYNYETERQKKIRALLVLFISIIVFFLTAIGLTDGLSEIVSSFLLDKLGFTDKWSATYGPPWFVNVNDDLSGLGGMIVLFIFLSVITIYFLLKKNKRRLWKFLFIVLGGASVMLTTKMIFANELPYEPIDLLLSTVSTYPSGHTMMGTIFYFTLAVYISRHQHSGKTKQFTLIAASVIIVLIGISRILNGSHTLTEVLAGWSLGLIWLCFCWFLERLIKKYRDEKKLTA
jgi:undecaprenyl-diphosphatase